MGETGGDGMKVYRPTFTSAKEQMEFMKEWDGTCRVVKKGLERVKNNEKKRIKKTNTRCS